MPSRQEIEEYMRKEFPECPICSSKDGYKAGEYRLVVMAECKNCGAKWGSPQFLDLKPMQQVILWQAPSDSRYRGLERLSKPPSFWTSSARVHEKRAYEKYGPKYGPALSGWDPEKCPRCGKPMIRGLVIATGTGATGAGLFDPLIFEPVEKRPPLVNSSYKYSRSMVGLGKWYIRSYMCNDCDIWVSYGQDPKTGDIYMPYREPSKEKKPWTFPTYQSHEEDKKRGVTLT